MIDPENLRGLVRNTAPFLFESAPPDGVEFEFLQILHQSAPAASGPGYFALCVAAHHATVATFVPTDVDAKIRGLLWRETTDLAVLRGMADLALRWWQWDLKSVSRRTVDAGLGPVSGHDGERMSVLAGAHGRFVALGDAEYAERLALALEEELDRELASFHRARDPLDQLKLAASLAHNLGDLNQGISFWPGGPKLAASRERFHKLGHEDAGRFAIPMRVYRELLAAEGHRNYPLRAVKALRQSVDLLYPQPPFVDDWGARVATSPLLRFEDRRDVLDALLEGCRKIPGQQAYYRAIAGFAEADPGQFQRAVDALPAASRRTARDADFRRRIAVPRASFESSYAKRLKAITG
jgi:hypothetical protein